MKQSKKGRVFFCVCVLFLLSLIFVICINFSGSRIIQSGVIYFDNGEESESYSYDFSTKKKEKVVIDGYPNISNYTPIKNGFVAISNGTDKYGNFVENADKEEMEQDATYGDILYCRQGEIQVIKREFNPYHLTVIENYIVYCTANNELIVINTNDLNRTVLCEECDKYIIVDNNLVFSKYNYEKSEYCEIYTFDFKTNSSPKLTTTGNLKTNTDNSLVIEKDKKLYIYDFTTQKINETSNASLMKQTRYTAYLGNFKNDKESYNVYVNWLYFSDINVLDWQDGEKRSWFIPIYQRIVIEKDGKKQYIYTNSHFDLNYNAYTNS